MKKILIIEDDKNINDMLVKFLSLNNYDTISAYSGTEGILLHDRNINLVLLDLMLPGKNGEEIIKTLKDKHNVPIIVTSAIHDIDRKVDLFDLGADDYVTKPFDNKELLARIKVQLKNNNNNHNNNKILKHRDIEIDIVKHKVVCNNQDVILTKNEFKLLKVLMEHPNQVMTKNNLFDLVWSNEDSADDNTLNVHISKIRSKLNACNSNSNYIETIWSIGYKLGN